MLLIELFYHVIRCYVYELRSVNLFYTNDDDDDAEFLYAAATWLL